MLVTTATNLPRIMACNGSRLMGDATPPVERDTADRDDGNAAHWLVQQVHAGNFTTDELIDRKADNGVYITSEMVEHLEGYIKDTVEAELEVDTSHSGENWQINGRADAVLYDAEGQRLAIADLKYGWSIVEPERNWTLISHALGIVKTLNDVNPLNGVSLQIHQPRPHHPAGRVRSVTLTYDELMVYANQIDNTLSDPNDELHTGAHCRHCPALATCPAARKAQLNAIEASDTAFVDTLSNQELSFQLDQIKRAIKVLTQKEKAYAELAQYKIQQGEIVENYSLDNDLANRAWQKHATPDFIKMMTGKILVKQQLITPAQAEKLGVAKELVDALTERKSKGVKLVRIDADTKAKKLFNQPKGA